MALPINTATQKDFRDDLTVSGAPWGVEESIVPVKAIGQGIKTPNNAQVYKTSIVLKNAASGVTYTQIATSTSSERIYFLGLEVLSYSDIANDDIYVEDASSGNISPSDASTVGLAFADPTNFSPTSNLLNFPRECKRGIRVKVSNSALSAYITFLIVHYLVVRTDGGLQSL